jgi:hypothetical protein
MANLKNTIINDTGHLTLPVGTTAQRPSVATGQSRFNSSLGLMEYYNGTTWVQTAQIRDGSNSTNRAVISLTDFDKLNKPAGFYWFTYPNQTVLNSYSQSFSLYYSGANFQGTGFGWVLVFESPYGGTATTNRLNISLSFIQIGFQRNDGAFWQTAGFNNYVTFNTRNDNATATTGTRIGYRVFLGYPGGMGIYNTGQSPCNWATADGAVGAGYDGASCGGFPNDVRWGTGNASSATYDNRSGIWQAWIRW